MCRIEEKIPKNDEFKLSKKYKNEKIVKKPKILA
jgi:hypothetical protein